MHMQAHAVKLGECIVWENLLILVSGAYSYAQPVTREGCVVVCIST